jgi:hypothetical protein
MQLGGQGAGGNQLLQFAEPALPDHVHTALRRAVEIGGGEILE